MAPDHHIVERDAPAVRGDDLHPAAPPLDQNDGGVEADAAGMSAIRREHIPTATMRCATADGRTN